MTLNEQPLLTAYTVLEYLMLNTDRIVSKNGLPIIYTPKILTGQQCHRGFCWSLACAAEPLKLIRTVRGQGYVISATQRPSVADA